MTIIDTHAHYDDEAYDADRDKLLSGELSEAGVELVVNMGAAMKGAEDSARLAAEYPMVYAGCGIHPDEVGVFEDAEHCPGDAGVFEDAEHCLITGTSDTALSDKLEKHSQNTALMHLRTLLSRPKVVCIGEIGLDYHWMVQPKEIQQKWFAVQLQLAAEWNLPINVHSREASQDTFDCITENHTKKDASGNRITTTGGIIHCYSGSVEMAKEYVKMGYHIGVGGVVTFKNSKKLRKVVEEIPIESIVTETDCPYMAPEPVRGTRNDSRNIRYVIQKIAEIKGMEVDACAEILRRNALSVYRIPHTSTY